ncbi:noggin A isoform X1 [Saccoglossus kowalevskii]
MSTSTKPVLVFLMLLGWSYCQPSLFLHDSPSDSSKKCRYMDLPLLDLELDQGSSYNPPQHELQNTSRLLQLLGERNFDFEYMRITRPKKKRLPVDLKLRGEIPEDIQSQNLRRMPDGTNTRVGPHSRKRFRRWLWARTHCPVRQSWKNLGKRFWPRWLKVGDCYQGQNSCSIPSGLTCLPSESTTKNVLFWACIEDRLDRKMLCRWIYVPYPIITECSCGGNCAK